MGTGREAFVGPCSHFWDNLSQRPGVGETHKMSPQSVCPGSRDQRAMEESEHRGLVRARAPQTVLLGVPGRGNEGQTRVGFRGAGFALNQGG